MKYNQKVILPITVLICLVFSSVSISLQAVESANTPLLRAFQDEEPELFKRVKIVSDGKRELFEISLEDILKLALNRSISIKAVKMGERVAKVQLTSVEEQFQSSITAKIQQNRTPGVSTNLNGISASPYISAIENNSTTVSTTWSKRNDLGITFSTTLQKTTSQNKLHYMTEEGGDMEGGNTTDNALESTSLSANISIPIMQDWGVINRISIDRSGLAFEQSRLTTQSTGIGLLESVANTFWTLVGIQENIKTLKDAVKLSDLLVKETQARVTVGVLNPTDLKEVLTQLASNHQDLLSARIQEQEVEDQIRAALNMGRIPYGFKPADQPAIHGEIFDFEVLLNKIFQFDTELKQLEISLKSNAYDLDEAQNQDKTNLDLDLRYSLSGYGSSTSESVQNFKHTQLHGYQVGLTWTVPLFDKVTPQILMKRRIERSKLELNIQNKRDQLRVNLQTILRNLRFGLDEKKTAQLSVSLAKDLLEKEIEKLKIGKSTSYNVSLAQQKYTNAKLSEIMVRIRNEQTFISLLVLTGDIFSHFNLQEAI